MPSLIREDETFFTREGETFFIREDETWYFDVFVPKFAKQIEKSRWQATLFTREDETFL